MQFRPEVAFKCGVFALDNVARQLTGRPYPEITTQDSPQGGFSLQQLADLARANGLGMKAMFRESGTSIVIPSVVHWKLDHYAAVLAENDGMYYVADPTFVHPRWMSAEVFNAEASGYFLVSESISPPGWRDVHLGEASAVHGRGFPHHLTDHHDGCENQCCVNRSGGDPKTPPGTVKANCEGCGYTPDPDRKSYGREPALRPVGMPVWSASEPYINLWLQDTPLEFLSAYGPPVRLELQFKQRGEDEDTHYSQRYANSEPGFGFGWRSSWHGYAYDGNLDASTVGDSIGYVEIYTGAGGNQSYNFTHADTSDYNPISGVVVQILRALVSG